MKAEHLRVVIEELRWHCDQPRQAAKLLTEAEGAEIVKRGFMPKEIWKSLELRIAEVAEAEV